MLVRLPRNIHHANVRRVTKKKKHNAKQCTDTKRLTEKHAEALAQQHNVRQTIKVKTDLFERITTSIVDETPKSKASHNFQKVSSWSYDMKRHAEQCVERCCALASNSSSQQKQAATPCIDDHHLKKEEDFEIVGALASVCAHIVLKCSYIARIGRPDVLWKVNMLGKSRSKVVSGVAKLINDIHHSTDDG